MKVAASTVRSHFIAGKGKKLIALDYAGVESRKNAWLWNESGSSTRSARSTRVAVRTSTSSRCATPSAWTRRR
jgi:hypothetical protein